MNIALDYDQTYTLNPRFWNDFIERCKADEFDVRVVTIRDERYDRTAPLIKLENKVPVIYTRGVAKRWFCSHFASDFQVDVWIDDKPETIIANSETTPEALAAWRAERGEPA